DRAAGGGPRRPRRRRAGGQPPAARRHLRPVPDREPRARAGNGPRLGGNGRRRRRAADLQIELRQGQPHQPQRRPRHRLGRGLGDPRRGARSHRPAGADRRPRRRAVRSDRGSGGLPPDPRLPVPANGPAPGRGRSGQAGERQEGPVPRALGHAQRRRQDRLHRQRERAAHRAWRLLRLQHARQRHARPAHPGRHRLSRGVRRDAFGAAARRPREQQRRPAGIRPRARPRRGGRGRRRGVHRNPPRSRPRPIGRAEHDPAAGDAGPARPAEGLRRARQDPVRL
ncbi:MAG: 2-Keto-3-deoxy-D-manno-octulosonate-8-phosphate synthase, partial [uncultured Acetobacteraceae bacterium]